MKANYQRINQNGQNFLEAIGCTIKLSELTEYQIHSIISIQSLYFLIIRNRETTKIILGNKKRQ